MNDDPFARAVERAEAAERAQDEEKRRRRQERLTSGSRTAFRVHAAVYLAVNLLLIAIWALTWQLNDATGYPWFIFVTLGWGIGLAAHYAAARNHLRRGVGTTTGQELSRLAELHRAGSLSDAEFETAKSKLLE